MEKFKEYTMIGKALIAAVLCLIASASIAQKDTAKKTTIDITSSYKPVLRNAVKINFSASHLNRDSVKPNLIYHIPAQNLFYSYQPISLKPLALQQDTNLNLGLRNYIKAGYGNFSAPYGSAGFSFGDEKKLLANLYADYYAVKGNIKHQEYAQFNTKAALHFYIPKNEIYAAVNFSHKDYNLYGYNHLLLNYVKSDVRQQFVDLSLHAGIKNTITGEYSINYNPSVWVSNFILRDKLSETSFIINAPVQKQFGEVFTFKLEAKADITTYATKGFVPANVNLQNNVFQVSPSLVFSTPRLSINGGIIPTWDKGKFVWLPNLFAEAQIQENVFLLQAGWIGRYTKNTFRNLSLINPYLRTITMQQNTRETEYYGGIKATLAKHFNFNAKVGWVTYSNLPFFINDTATDDKAFVISNESKVNNLRVHGDISYINGDKFTVTAGVTFNGYTGMRDNAKAWHTIPMEFTGSLRWQAFKQILLKADFYAFGGGHYLAKGNVSRTFNPGSDLSAGAEFRINKTFSAWVDVNNILNNNYQRWHNYEVLGLNLLGGVKVSL